MSNLDPSKIPPRPALSVPFPLQLGHDFHPASGAEDKISPPATGKGQVRATEGPGHPPAK